MAENPIAENPPAPSPEDVPEDAPEDARAPDGAPLEAALYLVSTPIGNAGDIDGDGRADVLVTNHRWEHDGRAQVGRIYGVLGSHPSGTLYFPDDADLVIVGSDTNGAEQNR